MSQHDSTSQMLPLEDSDNVAAKQVRGDELIPASQSTFAVFDSAFDTLKSNFAPIMLIVALSILPLHLLLEYAVATWLRPAYETLFAQSAEPDLLQYLVILMGYLFTGDPRNSVPGFGTLWVLTLTSAPVAIAIGQLIHGEDISVVACFKRTLASFHNLLGGSVIAFFCCVPVLVITFIALTVGGFILLTFMTLIFSGLAGGDFPNAVVFVISLVTVLMPYVLTALFYGRVFAFMVPAIVSERTSMLDGISRSQQLASCVRFRTTLATFTLFPIFVIILQLAVILGCQSALGILHLQSAWEFIGDSLISVVTICLFQAYWMVFISRLYFDYRIKRECLDIRLLAAREPEAA